MTSARAERDLESRTFDRLAMRACVCQYSYCITTFLKVSVLM